MLELGLPADTVCDAAIDDFISKVLTQASSSEELCAAVISHFNGILHISPSLREAVAYAMIDNPHLANTFRISIVNHLRQSDAIDEAEREKLLNTIETGQDNRRFKRMKIVNQDE